MLGLGTTRNLAWQEASSELDSCGIRGCLLREVRATAPNLFVPLLAFSQPFAHLHQSWVLSGGQPIDVVGSWAEVQAQEAWEGLGHTIASRNILSPVTHVDPQGLEAGKRSGR